MRRIGAAAAADQRIERRAEQRNGHDEDRKRDAKPRDIFEPSVPVRVIAVRLFRSETEAEQRDDGGAGVAEVVERIRLQGDRFCEPSCDELRRKQQQVQRNADAACQHAVCAADVDPCGVLMILNEDFCKQTYHTSSGCLL